MLGCFPVEDVLDSLCKQSASIIDLMYLGFHLNSDGRVIFTYLFLTLCPRLVCSVTDTICDPERKEVKDVISENLLGRNHTKVLTHIHTVL